MAHDKDSLLKSTLFSPAGNSVRMTPDSFFREKPFDYMMEEGRVDSVDISISYQIFEF